MKRAKKHIATIVLLVFTFPIFYQSLHLLHHDNYPNNITHSAILQVAEYAHCPICEYEFVKCDLSSHEHNLFYNTSFSEEVQLYQQPFIAIYSGTNTSLRAPPASS